MTRERYVDAYWERVAEEVRRFIGDEGIVFFKNIIDKCGSLNVVTPGPHPINTLEGQLVRRVMKRITCGHWREEDYDSFWEAVVLRALELDSLLQQKGCTDARHVRKNGR